jgi:aspartate/methionine/tyrosine aminotransferase
MSAVLVLSLWLTTLMSFVDARLTSDTLNPTLKRMEYAVRGQVVMAADKLNAELQAHTPHSEDFDFEKILYTNIGNPQSVGQKELTWPRQVLSLVDLPNEVGVDHPDVLKMYPKDAVKRAKEIKLGLGSGSGAYSHSKGARIFRDDVAAFIKKRDEGVASDPEDIYLTNGASAGIENVMKALIADPSCGLMIPIPQYPIYSALLDLHNGQKVPYYLDEDKCWDINIRELERSLTAAQEAGVNVVGLVLINPGNPTGQVLTKEGVQEVVRFCAANGLVLMSDEVYQENVYDDTPFYSSKRAAYDCGLLEDDKIQLVSFHSTSKGVFGECGRRGGYMELVGFDQSVKDQLYKLASSSLCSSISGQIMMSLMVRGPEKGDESYESHEQEKSTIFESLKRRSKIVQTGLNAVDGISCQPAQGAMYCFPSVQIPERAIQAAANLGVAPDTFYALSLLERTGVCVVPASGFGQRKGRFGFRTTFLPQEEDLSKAVNAIRQHHEEFSSRYQ